MSLRSLFIGLSLFSFFFIAQLQESQGQSLERYEFQSRQMGTTFKLTLYAPNDSIAKRAQKQAFNCANKLNSMLSDYDPDSNLNQLSAKSGTDQFFPVVPPLFRVLSQAQKVAYETDGAFDVTIGPVVSLWREVRQADEPALPSAKTLKKYQNRVGYQYLKIDTLSNAVALTRPGMKLDLGGIAKGFAADQMLSVLKEMNIHSVLVDAGGDIRLGDPPPDQQNWTITIPGHQQDGSRKWISLKLSNRAIATSGDLFQHVAIGGKRYSHIIDPRTGLGLTNQSMVTIIAPDGITADSYASAVSVLGPKDGMHFITNKPGVHLRIEHPDSGAVNIRQTPGFNQLTAD